jgi:hypothetical protein
MEHFFTCPYCWQRISMVLDISVKGQNFIEDCEVCCQPIKVRYAVEDDDVTEFEARALELFEPGELNCEEVQRKWPHRRPVLGATRTEGSPWDRGAALCAQA